MGTLARESAAMGLSAVIVSPDKDLLQLVSDDLHIQVLNTKDGEVWHDREGVKARMGVWPEQVVDFLSLPGPDSHWFRFTKSTDMRYVHTLTVCYVNGTWQCPGTQPTCK